MKGKNKGLFEWSYHGIQSTVKRSVGMNLNLDRRLFIASLGGAAAVSVMSDEAKADALEDALSKALDRCMHSTRT
jgi:hypothetical protein